jgi:NitT/TauT family transport system permease protein
MSARQQILAPPVPQPRLMTGVRRNVLSPIAENLPAVAFLALLLVAWEAYVRIFEVHHFILPAPTAIWETIVTQYPHLFRHTWVTAREIVLGFVIGNVAAVIMAVAIANSRLAERVFYPLIIAAQTIPKMAIAPLFLVWFGVGMLPKILITAVICFFPTVVNTVQGLRSLDPNAVNLLQLVAASRSQIFLKLQFPSALPYFFAGLRISIALAVIGAIVGEWVGASEGLGYLVMYATQTLRTDLVFAALVFIAGLGMTLYLVIVLIERLVSWQSSDTPIGGL